MGCCYCTSQGLRSLGWVAWVDLSSLILPFCFHNTTDSTSVSEESMGQEESKKASASNESSDQGEATKDSTSSSDESTEQVFDEPWRVIDWGNNEELVKELTEYQPEIEGVKHLRVLVYGPVGAGKSSLINSMISALLGRMTIPAAVSNTQADEGSFTVQYKAHRIRKGRGKTKTYYPFLFNDIMGLESDQNMGVRADDIKLAMMGHVREGYKFNPKSSISSTNASEINSSVIQKMKEVRQTARDLGIPQIAIGTHIDEMYAEIEKDLKNVYKSKSLRKKMEMFSSEVGIPLNCIMAVKNYSEETKNNPDMDTLILTALKQMVNFGDDFIEEMSEMSDAADKI
ncbi:hypothetical protein WMY93_007399 [Mugilogobius chulae]|uniref:G domain-containing protein n=1 Tax=Mugilogobius chulae TaxID=88201 RepID=A0AAW0PJE2_9GOBI